MNHKDRSVRIHQEEMESLLNLKSQVEYKEKVSRHAEEYQKLGWVLQAVNLQDGTVLEVDSGEDPETWVKRLWKTGLSGPKINLEVHTGRESQLLVLEVARGQGESTLDQCGEWRAGCIAILGGGRELHFYAWTPSTLYDSASCQAIPGVRWFGEGQVVPLPPSFDAEMQETWQWLLPPWEESPRYPSQALSRFLQQHLTRESQPRPEVSLSWQEVYCLVSPFEPLLQALSASYPSMWNYYRGVLDAAVAVGLKSPEVLLSLLWHAPRGNARQQPETWGFLKKLVAEVQGQPDTDTSPENVPWEVYLANFLALSKETSASSSEQTSDQSGPPCFLQRRLAKPPQPGVALRTPFSCRTILAGSRKD
jgi:hypothetical protein